MAHYCRGCGRMRPNEAFSGNGHKRHICKKCVCKQRAERKKRAAEETRLMEVADLELTGGRYFCDDGTEFNPDLCSKPDLCVTCKKSVGPVDYEETILCNLTRADQSREEIFICFGYEPNTPEINGEALLRDLCELAEIAYPEDDSDRRCLEKGIPF